MDKSGDISADSQSSQRFQENRIQARDGVGLAESNIGSPLQRVIPSRMPKQFVLAFLFDPTHAKVVLIRKRRPGWMVGLLNAVGGSVEDGETAEQAVREFREETGMTVSGWQPFLHLSYPDDGGIPTHVLECFWCTSLFIANAHTVTDEIVGIFDIESLAPHDDLVPDLQWILAMAREAATCYSDSKPRFEAVRICGEDS